MTPQERDLAIRTMLAEAGNQGPAGMAAVASVILNRAKAGGYGNGVGGVVRKPNQFEPWNEANRGGANDPRRFSPSSPDYQAAGDLLDAVEGGVIGDLTKGATHFFSLKAQAALGRRAPGWSRGQPGLTLGDHTFYAPRGPVQAARDPAPAPPASVTNPPPPARQPPPAWAGPMPTGLQAPSSPMAAPGAGDPFLALARKPPMSAQPAARAIQSASPSPPAGGQGASAGGGLPAGEPSLAAAPLSAAGAPLDSFQENGLSAGQYFGTPMSQGGGAPEAQSQPSPIDILRRLFGARA